MGNTPQWQPIETAPKDTPVLIWAEGEQMITAQYCTYRANNNTIYRAEWQLLDSGRYAEDHDMSYDPTHWMPLPEPPK